MKTIKVKTGIPYEILLGENLFSEIGERLKNIVGSGKKIAVITDDIVDKLYSSTVVDSLLASGFVVHKHIFTHGEKNKNIKTYTAVLEFLAQNLFRRDDVIIALGGGVVGDMAGFAAASYLRGIKYVQIPTTLLSAVDSSVGGKTGVNLDAGKNLVGAFHQPVLVVADTNTFKTLPEVEIKNGIGEIIKYGILMGGELWDLIRGGEFTSMRALELCIEYKRYVVENDERESGMRKLLNLGHTFGHAIEKLSDYKISHGVAVAAGIEIIARAENKAGNFADKTLNEIINILQKSDMLVKHSFANEQLIKVAAYDKKTESNFITLITINDIGDCVLTKKLLTELEEYLA